MRIPPFPPAGEPAPLGLQLAVATLARTFLNTARRFPYAFSAVLARGLGVPLVTVTSVIALSQATALLGPLFGPLADRWGYRRLMVAGMGMLTIGMAAVAVLPLLTTLLLGVFLASLGKTVFDPAFQAYVGQRVPFERRGLAIGLGEICWAASSLLGIPLVGLLMHRFGWVSPFTALTVCGALGLGALLRLMPRDREGASPATAGTNSWKRLLLRRDTLGALLFGFCLSVANDNLFVVYGAWLETRFGMGVVAVGIATSAIGLAELGGEGLTALLADRIGLRRALLVGAGLSALSYFLMPLAGGREWLGLLALFAIFLTYEFTIVTSFSLFTETVPEARATMMSAYFAALGLGRMCGALVGGPAWVAGGAAAVAAISATATGLGLALFLASAPNRAQLER